MKTDILMLYMPTADQKMLPMPPLGISVLAGYLKSSGINVLIDDLEMKYWGKDIVGFKLLRGLTRMIPLPYNNPKKIFLDKKIVSGYLKNGKCSRGLNKILKEWEFCLGISPAETKFIGFSVMGAFQLIPALCFAKFLKDKYNVRTIFGGSFITRKVDVLMREYDFIDYLITGEAEISLSRLIKGEEEANISNLTFKRGGRVIINPASSDYPESLTADFDGLPIGLYKQDKVLLFPYETSRGCRNKCDFCITRRKKLFFKAADAVSNEILELKQKYGVSGFVFVDNAININREFSINLCEQFIKDKLNIRWSAYFIPEKQDAAYFNLLKEAGCIQLRWGIETAGEKLLKKMNKNTDLAGAEEGLYRSSNAGIWNHLLFIIGHPGENFSDIHKGITFIKRNKDYFKSALVAPFEYDRVNLRGDPSDCYNDTYANGRFFEKELLGIKYSIFKDNHLELKRFLISAALRYNGIRPCVNFSKNKITRYLLKDQFIFNAFSEKIC